MGQHRSVEYVAGQLTRERLRALLERERVNPLVYNLEGSHGDEAYVLAVRPGGWAVFYAERGEEVGLRSFDTEDEACHYMLGLILRDPTTRRRP
jgi:hypothetical protein